MLTERVIRDARPTERTRIIWDGKVKGLGLRITPVGSKVFVLDYTTSGRRRRSVLAKAAEIALSGARALAGKQLVAIRHEHADPLEAKRKRIEAPTVAEGVKRFLTETAPERIALGRMSPRTLAEYRHQCQKHIQPRLGKRKVADVTRRDVELALKGIPAVTRNRVLALLSRLYSEFDRYGWQFERNPAKGVTRAREQARDRTLAPTEIQALATALRDGNASPAAIAAIRVAMLTGLRIGEVLAIRWEHVDFEGGRLTLPKTKTGRRQHDLPTVAQAIIAELPRINGNPWTFTTGRKAPVTYNTVRKSFADICATAGLEDVRLHDLRRTLMTNVAASGVGPHVLRDLLGHRSTAMADRYIRHTGSIVRDTRTAAAEQIAAQMEGTTAEVVRLRTG